MFWPDVIALKEFYSSPLGQVTCREIYKRVRGFWPYIKGDNIVGMGFATPYLQFLLPEAQHAYACMPAAQGVIHWPSRSENYTCLSDETTLPFGDNTINRIIVVHALENSEHVRDMMSELWRVLSPAGRLLVIVPNRRGLWARSPHSPFAYGQPFSAWQMRDLLTEHSFTPLRNDAALFFAPNRRRNVKRFTAFLEKAGHRFCPGFGGVLLMEAEKQIYAPAAKAVARRARRVYVPVAQPV